MNQLFLGAIIPYIAGLTLYLLRGARASIRLLIITPTAMLLCALWAIAPDIPRVVGFYALYHRLARNPRCDIFFWHYTIDRIEGGDVPFHALLILLILSMVLAAWRELACRERNT